MSLAAFADHTQNPDAETAPRLLLVTATVREMQACLSPFAGAAAPEEGQALRQVLGGISLVTAVSGVGPVNAALCCGRWLSEYKPLGLCNLGVAGSFDLAQLGLGQPCAITQECWPEIGLRTENGVDPRGLGLAHGKIAGRVYWNSLELDPARACREMGLWLPPMQEAKSLSVAGVTGSAPLAEYYRRDYGVQVENMEGFALAWGARCEGVPFLELRTVSNRVGSRAARDWALQEALSALGPMTASLLGGGVQGASGAQR
ncbi:MAG: futalosine hydrolase [Thermodesulfobacteriota bacterium]